MTNSRGLELGDMENVSGEEVSAFANFYNSVLRAVSREQVVNIAGSASLNGGMAGFSIMAKAAGDVLRDWEATVE
jgi:hypothetical protein